MKNLPLNLSIAMLMLFGFAMPAEAANCGAKNQRPCTIFERIPSCNAGLYEHFGKGLCLSKTVPGRDCGRQNQRPCTITERIPSCNKGLIENFSNGRCERKPVPGKDCGRQNQRPCTIAERIPSCNSGMVEDFGKGLCVRKAVPGVDCGQENQRPCTIVERIPSCNDGMVENFAKGLCVRKAIPGVDCGNENQRPCTIIERIPSCSTNLKEHFGKGICVAVQCGKELGRPCTIIERIPSCDYGLVENFLKGRCVLSEDAERHRIAGEKLQQIGSFIAAKVDFATQVASNPQIQASLNSGNERAVAQAVDLSDVETVGLPDGDLIRTLSIGATAGGRFIFVGTSGGAGAAIDLQGELPVYAYATGNYSFGPGLAAGGGIDVGFWVCQNNKIGGDSWGVEFGVDDIVAAARGASSLKKGPSIGIGLWFDYSNVFQGFTITPGFGVGVDFGGVVYAGTAVDGDETVNCDGRTIIVNTNKASASARSGQSAHATTPSPYSATQELHSCSKSAQRLRGTGQRGVCLCSTKQTRTGNVWGLGPYTDDSSLCRAAVHAGVITNNGGAVEFQLTAGQSSYQGAQRNGVKSAKYGQWPGGVIVRRPSN